MLDDRLNALLHEADRPGASPLTDPVELAGRVRSIYQRRRQRRVRAVAVLMVVALSGLWWQGRDWLRGLSPNDATVVQSPDSPPVVSAAQIAVAKAELSRCTQEIDREQRIVERLLAAERLDRLAKSLGEMKIAHERQSVVADQVGRAALAMLLAADQKQGSVELQASAQQDYTRVIDLFPNTPWASEARGRLSALSP